jgi:hypothetical protein
MPRLELDEDVHVAVGAEVVVDDRAEQGERRMWFFRQKSAIACSGIGIG